MKRALLEHADVEHRVRAAPLDGDEHGQQRGGEGERAEAGRRGPAVVRALRSRPTRAATRRRSTAPCRPGRSARTSRVAARRHEAGDERERHDDHGDVDDEHRAPPEVLEQPAAGDRPERHAEPGRWPPRSRWPPPARPDRVNTLTSIASVAGKIEGGADAHQRPGSRSAASASPAKAPSALNSAEPRHADQQRCPCGRSGRRSCRPRAASRRTPACRRRRSTAAGWWWRRARVTSEGRATLTIVPSSVMTSTERQRIPSTSQRRAAGVE